jgi:TPR repeat protein
MEKTQLQELLLKATEGDAAAQNQLGARLAMGSGVRQDLQASLYWYFEAIRQGYVQAKWNAGTMLLNKEVVRDDGPALGMALIEEAAAANDNSACLFLAKCYEDGTYGKKVDEDLAHHWMDRARDYKNIKIFDIPSKAIDGIILPPPSIRID